MIKEYRAYLKDNPHGYWFKAKLYGWGWTPATWQGWLVIAFFIAAIIGNFYRIDSNSHSASDTLMNFIPQTGAFVVLLLAICWKTGERPHWQWGIPKKYFDHQDIEK